MAQCEALRIQSVHALGHDNGEAVGVAIPSSNSRSRLASDTAPAGSVLNPAQEIRAPASAGVGIAHL
jgi:hypothetical protein